MKKRIKRILGKFVEGVLFVYCKIVYRLKIVGIENIPDEQVIFCANHRSFIDAPIIKVTCKRDVRFLAKKSLSKNPLFAFLGWIFEVVYVKRDEKDISALKTALKTLKDGKCLGLFPEGTRNGLEKNDGKVKNGAAYMALKTGAKVVPIGIVGPAKPFTKNAIIYGKPLDFSEYRGDKKAEKEAEDKVSEIIMNEIIKLSKTEI